MARTVGTARVAVVGAGTPSGARIRAALAERGIPGERVDLYADTGGEVVLSEYDGEARLIQSSDPVEIVRSDVIFLCEGGDAARRVLDSAPQGALVLDLVAAGAPTRARLVEVPQPLATLLTDILRPVQSRVGVRQATAVVIRPASDFGQAGLEELRDQTVRLLSFASTPQEVFGRQLAFNVIPQALLASEPPGLEERIAREVERAIGWPGPRLTVALLTAPLFYGHAVMLRLEPETATDAGALGELLRDATGLVGDRGSSEPALTPLEAADRRGVDVTRVRPDGLGGFWVWAVAGEAEAVAAEQAVALAASFAPL